MKNKEGVENRTALVEVCIIISSPVEVAFSLATDIKKLPQFFPWFKFRSEDKNLKKGVIYYSKFFLLRDWERYIILDVKPNALVVGKLEGKSSLFSFFQYEHRFIAIDKNSTISAERVEYILHPSFRLLNPIVKFFIGKMLKEAHKKLKIAAEKENLKKRTS